MPNEDGKEFVSLLEKIKEFANGPLAEMMVDSQNRVGNDLQSGQKGWLYTKEQIHQEFLSLLQQAIRQNNLSIVSTLLSKHTYSPQDLNEYVKNAGPMGAKFIHLAASRDIAMVKELENYGANINSKDFFGNTCLHYAAMTNNQNNIKYFLQQKPEWENEKNYFGMNHIDMLQENRTKKLITRQSGLLAQIEKYLILKGRDTEFIANVKKGLCHGITFFEGISILRGKASHERYLAMRNEILKWDGKNMEITNEELKAEFIAEFTSKKETAPKISSMEMLFEYMLNHYAHFLGHSHAAIHDFSNEDRSALLSAVNLGKDKVDGYFDLALDLKSPECHELSIILQSELNKPNTYVDISFDTENDAHTTGFAVNQLGEIYFLDSSVLFDLEPLKLENINQLISYLYYSADTKKIPGFRIECYEYTKDFILENIPIRDASILYNQLPLEINENALVRAANNDCPKMFEYISTKKNINELPNSQKDLIHEELVHEKIAEGIKEKRALRVGLKFLDQKPKLSKDKLEEKIDNFKEEHKSPYNKK